MEMGVRFPFVPPLAALLLWLGLAPAAIAQTPHKRNAIAASLERMMAGEVLHTNYGEGSRVQMALDAAFERGDTKLIRLAHRHGGPSWRPLPSRSARSRSRLTSGSNRGPCSNCREQRRMLPRSSTH